MELCLLRKGVHFPHEFDLHRFPKTLIFQFTYTSNNCLEALEKPPCHSMKSPLFFLISLSCPLPRGERKKKKKSLSSQLWRFYSGKKEQINIAPYRFGKRSNLFNIMICSPLFISFPSISREKVAVTKNWEAAGCFIFFFIQHSRMHAVRLSVTDPSFLLFYRYCMSYPFSPYLSFHMLNAEAFRLSAWRGWCVTL